MNFSERTKRIVSYGASVLGYGALLVSAIVGWPMSWWQPVTAVVAFALNALFGIEWSVPKRLQR